MHPESYALVQLLCTSAFHTAYLVPMDRVTPELRELMRKLHGTYSDDTELDALRKRLLDEIEPLYEYIYEMGVASVPEGAVIAYICQINF